MAARAWKSWRFVHANLHNRLKLKITYAVYYLWENKIMGNVVTAVALSAIGLGLAIFRKPFAEFCIAFQIQVLHMPFGQREVELTSWLALCMGLAVCILGVLSFFGVVK